jgi:hypothetical protein
MSNQRGYLMTLADARILTAGIGGDHDDHVPLVLHPKGNPDHFRNWTFDTEFKLEIVQYWAAVVSIQRHLPTVVYPTFDFYLTLGYYRAKGARYVPFRKTS